MHEPCRTAVAAPQQMTRQSIDRHNFTWLLAALLIFLVAVPLADEVAAGSATVGALIFSLLAVIGIWSLRDGGRLYWLGLFFVVAVIATNAVALVLHRAVHAYGTFAAVFGFLLVSILFTLGRVARGSGWLYFSFITMTTLGYGDVAPVSAFARTLAYLQAIFGQFYIAILVAGLVCAYITARGNERH